ncbi:hypothetical protein Tco_0654360 [Tanacetum coccineum]|uniref:Xylulose kinase-1 n=1 Tax=Tanacetum coccineum TaxID=301880 RepID=A0ABQ4X2Z7_9ASTR
MDPSWHRLQRSIHKGLTRLEAYKVVNDGDDSESFTSDNDARDQASVLQTIVLVEGKQDEAKVVVMADEQNSDERKSKLLAAMQEDYGIPGIKINFLDINIEDKRVFNRCEDHLAKFHKMTDAKEMWDAIKSRFGGNDESKKMQKYILKQQFEGFSVSNTEGLQRL